MTTIKLYGKLGKMCGRVHHVQLDSNNVSEAIRYLCSQFPGVERFLMNAHKAGLAFAVFRGMENITEKQLHEPVGDDTIYIVPQVRGAKEGGVLNIILGIVLVVVGVFTSGSTWGWAYAELAIGMGASMIAGGVVQLLSPTPKLGGPQDRPENQPSYAFNGAVNTEAQGHPVPLLYGRMIVGSAVVSAGINAEDYSPALPGIGDGHDDGHGGKWDPDTPYEGITP